VRQLETLKVIILGVTGIGGSFAAFVESQNTSTEWHGVKKLKDLLAYHVQEATKPFATSFGGGNTTMPSNVMLAANIIQPWTILNFWVSIHGKHTQICKTDVMA